MGYSVYPAAAAGLSVRKSQTFTSSGTFTLPSGYGASKPLVVDLEICGGGGGGGGGAYNAAAAADAGGGGGSGVTTVFNGVSLTANATITIGAGGSGGSAGGATGGKGANGGASDVNSTYYSPGGGGGGSAVVTGTARYGGMVNSYGYFIPGGYLASAATKGPGGGGGSGGAPGEQILSNPVSGLYYAGGIYGYPSMRYNDNTNSSTTFLASGADTEHGKGLSYIIAQAQSLSSGIITPNRLQRGGGGGGGSGSSANTYGTGGAAGTTIAGGLTGIRSQTTGSKNGSAATDAGCGGGGGGGSYNSGGAAGAGGNGAAGYITIYWWE